MGLEESHLMVSKEIVYHDKDKGWITPFKWKIRDPEIEKMLKGASLTYRDTVKPNSWTQKGHRFDFTLMTADKKAATFGMEIMIGNCGAVVWHRITNYNDDLLRMVDFIVKNIASYSGTSTIIATGYQSDTDKLTKLCGWPKAVENYSGRGGYMMGYAIFPIPKEQMAHSGYNYHL